MCGYNCNSNKAVHTAVAISNKPTTGPFVVIIARVRNAGYEKVRVRRLEADLSLSQWVCRATVVLTIWIRTYLQRVFAFIDTSYSGRNPKFWYAQVQRHTSLPCTQTPRLPYMHPLCERRQVQKITEILPLWCCFVNRWFIFALTGDWWRSRLRHVTYVTTDVTRISNESNTHNGG